MSDIDCDPDYSDPMVCIRAEEYDALIADKLMLRALRGMGVDNWDGWDDAMDAFDRLMESKNV